jgi:SOS-response transcriptional repressor LexA
VDREFINRVKSLVNDTANGVYSRFALTTGVTPTTMQRYLEGRAQPGYNVIKQMCAACGVTPNWLLFGWEPKYGSVRKGKPEAVRIVNLADAGDIRANDFITVPVLLPPAWREIARGILLIGPETTEGFTLASATLGSRLCAVRAPDDAMAPEIVAGDLLLIDMTCKDYLELHESVVFAEINGGMQARGVNGHLLLSTQPRRYPPVSARHRKILGAVVQIQRNKICG